MSAALSWSAPARAALAFGLSLALVLTGCKGRGKGPDATKTPAPVLSVRVAPVAMRALEDAVTVTGAIAPWQTVSISPQSAGLQVLSVDADEGQRVRRGQVLATLDNRLSTAQLANARAAVASAEANLADARYNFERYKALRAEGGVTGPEMSQRQTAVTTATSNVAQARASLAQVQVQFGQAAVTAPVGGLVLTRTVQIGDVSAVGKAMFTLARDGRLEMDANVAEADLGRVRVGQAATVSSDAVSGLKEKGTIEAISPGLNTQSRLAVVKIRLPNPSRFRVGMFATGRIALGSRASLAVSSDAVATRDGRAVVFVVDAQDVVHLRPVEALDAVGGWTPVSSGVQAGERVVTDGVGFLKEGDRVTVIAGVASPRPSAGASAPPAPSAPPTAPGSRGTVAAPSAPNALLSPVAPPAPSSAPVARPSVAVSLAPAPSASLAAPSAFPSAASSRGPVTTVPTPEASLGARIFVPTTAPSVGGDALMNVSAWAIRNPIPVILLFLVLTIAGVVGYRSLGINDSPDVDFPIVLVNVAEPGASPTELETDVTRKVEDALVGIPHLDHITSTVLEGASSTVVQFQVGTNSETALSDVRDAVSRIRSQLPAAVTDPVIVHPTSSGLPFITYSVSSDQRSVAALSRLIDEDVTKSLTSVPGVSQIQRSGGLNRQVRVELDPARLQALGTTVSNVTQQVRAMNLNLPGGTAYLGAGQQGIRTLGAVATVQGLAAMPIILNNGTTARLSDLGTVKDSYADVRQMALLDGKPVVSFSVVRAQGAPLVQTEEATRVQVEKMRQTLPPDVKLELITTTADVTRANFHASIDALVIGAVLAVVVIYAFLRSWQATIIAATAIPLSIFPTFAVMQLLGYTLNNITLLGLTLVVGILVDDAIVDLENIHRHIQMGKSRMQAAFDATNEIGLAVVATTMAIVAVFVPVAFMGGIAGLFFRSFGLTVTVSVLFSLLVARTATPLMAAYMLPEHSETEAEPFYRRTYIRMLGASLNHRWLTLFAAFLIFVGSMFVVPLLPKGFFSAGDTGAATISVQLPAGVDIARTRGVVDEVNALLTGQEGIKHVFATVGNPVSNSLSPQSGGSGISAATVNVYLVPRKERKFSVDEFVDRVRPQLKQIPGARVDIYVTGNIGSAKPVNLILRGDDPDALARANDAVMAGMRGLDTIQDVTSSSENLTPEVHITPRVERATQMGVSVQAIANAVRLATQGENSLNLPKFNAGSQQVDILVELNRKYKTDLSALRNLTVQGANGLVPLQEVADIELGSGPVSIQRYDRDRQLTITANTTGGDLGKAMSSIMALPAVKNLPAGVSTDTSGQSKFIADIFAAFGQALAAGVMFIYIVLVLLFSSFTQPITIMMALPMSFAGAFLGLLMFHKDLGMMALIGIVMLMGLVSKNSILLVDYAIEARKKGVARREALLNSGHDRVRPILMTTIAMIAGMLPIALSFGEGTERMSPMACAVIGGLLTSTLLTLMVVPSVFTVVDDVQNWFKGLFRRGRKAAPATVPTPPEPPTEPTP